ncbi:MAG TPA: transposase [Terriglobales bacterium]|nr:transposase [Terriglobales bacterium]
MAEASEAQPAARPRQEGKLDAGSLTAVPARNSRFFSQLVTTKSSTGRALLQSERNAMLFIEELRSYVAAPKFRVHDFVVMPDQVHIVLTVDGDMSIERAVQFIKGGFSYRLKKEDGYNGEVWQRGFSEVRVEDSESLLRRREYIARNPVKRGLVVARTISLLLYAFGRPKSRRARAQ